MKRNLIWISFDLGVQGDYEGLYTWLDGHAARECGDSIAVLDYEYENDLLSELKEDLQSSIRTDKRSRIYVIRLDKGQMKGAYIFGERKSAPWAGYAPVKGEQKEDVAA